MPTTTPEQRTTSEQDEAMTADRINSDLDASERGKAGEGITPPLPTLMRAAIRHRYGDSSVLEVGEVVVPPISPTTVLVEVVSTTLNPLDWHMMTGRPWLVRLRAGLRRPKVPALGVDFAGRIVAVGSEVDEYSPGDEVVGMGDAAFAQYVAASSKQLVAKPVGVTFDQAAGMGVAGITALQGLRDKAELSIGQKVLINGASGGVGTVAVQLAKLMGAEVTAVCSTSNVELVQSLGADHVIDYTEADFTDTEERYNLIFDNQGNRALSAVRRIMSDDGLLLLVGGPKRNRLLGPFAHVLHAMIRFQFRSQRVRSFVAEGRNEDLAQLMTFMGSGDLRAVAETVYPLDELDVAMDRLAEGHVRGKLIIHP